MRRCLFLVVNSRTSSCLTSVLPTAIVSENRNVKLGCACISVFGLRRCWARRMLVFTSVSAV
jgi:hypothetical protein